MTPSQQQINKRVEEALIYKQKCWRCDTTFAIRIDENIPVIRNRALKELSDAIKSHHIHFHKILHPDEKK